MTKRRLYSTAVQKDYSFFNEINLHASFINEEQILSHFFMGRYTEKEIIDFSNEVNSILLRFKNEKRDIFEFSISYNDKFATDNNECFETVLKLCKLLRKTLRGVMTIFQEFCSNKKHKVIYRNGKSVRLSVHTHSDLGARYTQLLIPFSEEEAIPKSLRNLANLLLEFFVEIMDVMGICEEVMDEEMKIRQDYPRLRKIYDGTIQAFDQSAWKMLYCPDTIEQIKDPMTREMLQTETDKWNEILSRYFHKKTVNELMIHHAMFIAFNNKYGFVPTEMETKLWGGDHDKIKKVRQMVASIDELKPVGQKDKQTGNYKFSGKWMAKLLYWALRGNGDKNLFVKYFNETYKGIYQTLDYKTIVGVSLSKKEKDECVLEFENFLNSKKENVIAKLA